jgi:hypothetical protein
VVDYRNDLERRGKFLTLGHLARLLNAFTQSDSARMSALHLLIGITDIQFGKEEAVLTRFQADEVKAQAKSLIANRRSSQN